MSQIGNKIERLRKQRHLSRAQLSWDAQISYAGLLNIETGKRTPWRKTVYKLYKAMGVHDKKYRPRRRFPHFAHRFKHWLSKMNLTVEQLHRISGVPVQSLRYIALGRFQPNARTFYQIVHYLPVKPLKLYFYLYNAPDTFGSLVKGMRFDRGMLTTEAADILNCRKQSSISNVEQAKGRPALVTIRRFAYLFAIKPSTLWNLYINHRQPYGVTLLQDYALDHNLTYHKMATLCNISYSHFYKIMQNRVGLTMQTKMKMIVHLGLPSHQVLAKNDWNYIGTNGYYLLKIITSHDLSIRQFAKRANVSYQAVANYVHNQNVPERWAYLRIKHTLERAD